MQKMREIPCVYLGEEPSMKRDSNCKGTEAGACIACLGNSKDVSVADVDGVTGREWQGLRIEW